MFLLPQPKKLELTGGAPYRITRGTRLFLPGPGLLEASEVRAAFELMFLIEKQLGHEIPIDRLPANDADLADLGTPAPIVLRLRSPQVTELRLRDAYEMTIDADRIEVVGASGYGLFYAIQTLIQIVEREGGEIPACHIWDEPDFAYRGLSLDVSRGRLPNGYNLTQLLNMLINLKVNMLQLYVEHPFQFRFDPSIAHAPDGFTSTDIIDLVHLAYGNRLEVVPSLQSFGHMAGVLSLPQYKHLAEVELPAEWEGLTSRQRMRGATIDASNPESRALLERMHGEYLPLHESQFVNMNADETYDVGKGRGAAAAEKMGKGRLYLSHIQWLNELAHKHGKRMMFWGDIVKEHPDLVPEIPKDVVALNWGYSARTDYESTKLFADAGLDFFVCPGTNSWLRFTADVETADINIRTYAATGKKYGALGLLNTEWGDDGHYNLFVQAKYGIVLGACMAWNAEGPASEEFDRAFCWRVFREDDDAIVRHLRAMSVATPLWFEFIKPLGEKSQVEWAKIDLEQAERLDAAAAAAEADFAKLVVPGSVHEIDTRELLWGTRMNRLLAERIRLAKEHEATGAITPAMRERLRVWADSLAERSTELRTLWLKSYRESNLADLERAFAILVAEARRA